MSALETKDTPLVLTRLEWAIRAEAIRTLRECWNRRENKIKAARLLGCNSNTLLAYTRKFRIEQHEWKIVYATK